MTCAAWQVRWTCDVMSESPAVTGQAVLAASEVLWALTGRRFGACPETIRPCRAECGFEAPWGWFEWPGAAWPRPALISGLWYNIACGICRGSCSCAAISEVVLPAYTDTVTQVKVNGVVLNPSAYRLDGGRRLVRLDGVQWPRCNNLNLADTEAGTWSVTATFGEPVPELGMWAVGELACEFIKARNGEDCRLPANVQSLARQGVSISMLDTSIAASNGLTGLYLTDMFIRTVNPHRLTSPSAVYHVDGVPSRRIG